MYQNKSLRKFIKFAGSIAGVILILWIFQNCSVGFEVKQFDQSSIATNLNGLASPFKTDKVIISAPSTTQNTAVSGKATDSSETQLNLLQASDTIATDLSLAALVYNRCLQESSKLSGSRYTLSSTVHLVVSSTIDMPQQLYKLVVSNPAVTIDELKLLAHEDPCIIGISNNPVLEINSFTDPNAADQSHHQVLETESALTGTGYFSSNNTSNKPEVIVAVVDTGVNINHPDLIGRFWTPPNGGSRLVNLVDYASAYDIAGSTISEDNPRDIDRDGHGTYVTGLIAASINNNIGVAGITNNNIKIMPIKASVTRRESNGRFITTIDFFGNGVLYAIHNHADVVNMSFGLMDSTGSAYFLELARLALMNNVVLVVAAGNDNARTSGFFPASFGRLSGFITVASVNADTLNKSSFSNYGHEVDMVAPGCGSKDDQGRTLEEIISTNKDGGYGMGGRGCGTSLSTPLVVGAAALVIQDFKSKGLDYSAHAIEDILKNSASRKIQIAPIGAYPAFTVATQPPPVSLLNLRELASALSQKQSLNQNEIGIRATDHVNRYLLGLFSSLLQQNYDPTALSTLAQQLGNHQISLEQIILSALPNSPVATIQNTALRQSYISVALVGRPIFFAGPASDEDFVRTLLAIDSLVPNELRRLNILLTQLPLLASDLQFSRSVNYPPLIAARSEIYLAIDPDLIRALNQDELRDISEQLNNGRSRDDIIAQFRANSLAIASNYVRSKFISILGRTTEENAQDERENIPQLKGINHWVNRLKNNQVTRENFEEAIRVSPEWHIRGYYNTELDRRADFAGVIYWVKEVESGTITLSGVQQSLRNACTNHTVSTIAPQGECPNRGGGGAGSAGSAGNTPPAVDITELTNYVRSKFISILGRTTEENAQDERENIPQLKGINHWVNRLKNNQVTRENFEEAIRVSPEWHIRGYYSLELDRRADFTGVIYWVKEVESGAITLAGVRQSFVNACTNHTGNTPATPNSGECLNRLPQYANSPQGQFLVNLYSGLLARPTAPYYDVVGLIARKRQLYAPLVPTPTKTCNEIAREFINSPELASVRTAATVSGATSAQRTYLIRLYRGLLRRPASPEPDVSYWLGDLSRGQTLSAVENNIMLSDEFRNLCLSSNLSF